MQLELSRRISQDASAAPSDVRFFKKALNRLGYYRPDPDHGITDIADRTMIEALKNFQRDRGLPAIGIVVPGDATFAALNKSLAEKPKEQLQWHCVKDGNSCSACVAYDSTIVDTDSGDTPNCAGNCRCWVTVIERESNHIIDKIEPVYPEWLLLPWVGTELKELQIAAKILQKFSPAQNKLSDNLTWHGNIRVKQRDISPIEIQEAMKTAKQNGNIIVKTGKYGTLQNHYTGSNGVTVIEETSGRNAGKVITSWRHK